jgi:membrane protein DedA with SNARE-associated domain
MPLGRFQLYTFIGSWPWCFALAYVGEQLGARWDSDPALRELFHRFDAVIVAAVFLLVLLYVVRHWKHRLRAGE